jgi:hypothetical protein
MVFKESETLTPAAMADLGGRLLIGRDAPIDPARGVALLRRAMAAGDGEAAALMAVLHGAGAWITQSWDGALDCLETGARLGSRRAGAQLRLLAGAEDGDDWGAIRRRIDLAPWLSPPGRRVLCESPRVRMSEGFAPAWVGDWIISQVRGRMRQALMYHGDIKQAVVDPHRSCSDFEYDLIGSDLILILIRNRIAAATGLPVAAMEPPRVLHYAVGQEIKSHYDRINDGIGDYARTGYKGDRIVTFLLYLNEDFDGGDLEFPKVGKRFRGKTGDAIYFAHVDHAGAPDRLSLHAGLPILRGEKYLFSQWIHDRPLVM